MGEKDGLHVPRRLELYFSAISRRNGPFQQSICLLFHDSQYLFLVFNSWIDKARLDIMY
jgi:hypothetical protein